MYYTWKCDDLGGVTLYAAEWQPNPDTDSRINPPTVTMIDKAISYNILDHFFRYITAALNNQTDYNTGIIKICRFLMNGTLSNNYYQWQALVSGSNQTVTIRFGYGDGTNFTSSVSHVYTYSDFHSISDGDETISIIYCRGRNDYSQSGSPGYDGYYTFRLISGPVAKRIGAWQAPTTQYPNGRMTYAFSSYGLISDIPGGATMCYSDNTDSRRNQSELAATLIGPNSESVYDTYNSTSQPIPCAYDGSYDQSTEQPDPNENDPGGNSGPGGGGGSHSRQDDDIPLPALPDLSVSDAGMITLYTLTPTEMQTFTNYLYYWDPSDPLNSVWHWLSTYFSDPLDFIVGLRVLPFTPTSTRRAKPKFGSYVWPNAYDVVTGGQYREILCGSIFIDEYWGAAFDYDPYTRVQIFLPGIGFRELPVDDIMNKTIAVTYHVDCFTGDCVAFVHTPTVGDTGPQKSQIIAQYGGNLGYTVPLAKVSYDNAVQGGITLMSRALGFVTNAFIQGGGDSSEVSAGNMVESTTMQVVNSSKRSVERSGAAGSTIGYMSSQRPYIVKTLPRQSLPAGYKDIEGYPANLGGTLAMYRNSGFTTIEKITLTGLSATDAEKKEIEGLLKGGVLI